MQELKMKLKTGIALLKEMESLKAPTTFGSGWLSGVSALLLATIGLLSVLCLHYPNLLTVPEIQAAIDVSLFRVIIKIVLIAGFILSCISLILRQNKLLGMTAIVLVMIAIVMGGSASMAVYRTSGNIYFGLDWFLLNLIMTGVLFLPLERLFRLVEQSVFRTEWREDLFYFFISSIMIQSITYLSMIPATNILQFSDLAKVNELIAGQPIWVQFIEIMIFTDFVQYWLHRSFHMFPFLWRFHAIHHSAQALDWLAGSRMHFCEIICLRGATVIPMYILGFDNTALYSYIILVYLYATYVHSNLKFDIEFLKPFLVTPRFHHWHHGIEKEAIDVNFSIHFPLYDRLFGTYYMPKKKWPSGYGIKSNPVPAGYIKQFLYPFKKKK